MEALTSSAHLSLHIVPSPPATAALKTTQTRSSSALSSSLHQRPAPPSLRAGAADHARALRLDLLPGNPHLVAHLLTFYASRGLPDSARAVLSSHPHNTFFYNSLIRAYTTSSLHSAALDVFLEMLLAGAVPNEFTFPFVVKSCAFLGLLGLGRQVHAAVVKTALFTTNVFCASALLDLYTKLASLCDACQLFDRIPLRNAVTWNSMISAYAQNGFWDKGLELLCLMEKDGVEVDASSWNSVIAGCVRLGDAGLALEILGEMLLSCSVMPNVATFNTLLPVIPYVSSLNMLRELHGFALRNLDALDLNPVDDDRLRSAIANGYAFHCCMGYASRLFERINLKNSQLCNSMISGFLDQGQTDEALIIFREMAAICAAEAIPLSRTSLTLLLPQCSQASKAGLEIHAYTIRMGLDSNTSVSNALMAMYAKKGDRAAAERVFLRTPEKDVVSWNTIMSSYAQIHDYDQAFEVFQHMLAEGVRPDEYSFSSILNGCGYSSYLRQGMTIHGHMIKSGLCQSYLVVQNALMDSYAKCGCVDDARMVFEEMDLRDNITWNTIISCYGFSSCPHEAFSLFYKMQEQGWKPNRVTFVALLSACSHVGLVDEGFRYFELMTRDHGILPDISHYACIVDNLGRVGQLDRAYKFVKDMPIEPDDCIWGALLSSCRIHGNVELAEIAAKHLIELEPQHSGYWVLLSNVYADASRWNDVAYVRQTMKDGGVKKYPGYSWLEIGGSELHRFLTADMSHKQCSDIYLTLDGLTNQLKDEGYIPSVNSRFDSSNQVAEQLKL